MKNPASLLFVVLLYCTVICLFSPAVDAAPSLKRALFAGGCFWCMEKPFETLSGVRSVISGYTGGTGAAPTYQTYAAGGHVEAVEVVYDPALISYERLLEVFWRQIDPTDAEGQFVDRGRQYASAIFYSDREQKDLALASRKTLQESGRYQKPVVTPILAVTTFYPAEDSHQDYYKKNPVRYGFYRASSGRDKFLETVWAKKESAGKEAALKKKLSAMQYHVTREEGTEPAFKNEFWNHKEAGIYVDVVSGEPLFSSLDKYDSGTGWPSFTRSLVADNIALREDRKFFSVRTEVRSKKADSHLGHVFADGPPPTGKRYCINSAALRFVPVRDMEKEGYAALLSAFWK